MNASATDTDGATHWRLSVDAENTAWLCLDKVGSSTNVLSREVMEQLDAALIAIETHRPRGLVIHSGKENRFIAGADVHEFPLITDEATAAALAREGQRICSRLNALPCPSIAVINGDALGGGLELALSATWRLAIRSANTTLGFPEVKLGLHPGFGGTVRSVRLLGARTALELMLTGRTIALDEAKDIGLIDAVCADDRWREEALLLLAQPPKRRQVPLLDRLLALSPVRPRVAASMERRVRTKADPEHYPAPFAIISLWRDLGACSDAAFAAEAASFGQLAISSTSRNLVRVFFLQDRLKHLAQTGLQPVTRVHVIGAGVMGGDIAAWCAARGLQVTLQDRELRYIEPAIKRAETLFSKMLKDPDARALAHERLQMDLAGNGIATADVVIEAIVENLEAKRSLLQGIENRLRPGCLLASNTSSIPLEDLATCLKQPDRLIGLHFFNPVAKLPLVEVVQTAATSAASLHNGLAFARQIGKLPLPCRSHPGFLVNRILGPYLAEALTLVQEGVAMPEIDRAATMFGMPMGPIELADSVGLDVVLHVARILAPVLNRPVARELDELVQAGRLGRKTGQGFYSYHEGRPVRPPAPNLPVDKDVQDRLVFALLNEAAHCIADNIVSDPDLIDAGVVFGTGFAPFRGGPIHYARELGINTTTERLLALASQYGPRFIPSRGWDQLRLL